MYEWVFNRQVGPIPSDRFVLVRDGKIAGGSALTFRPLRTSKGKLMQAAVITGSFTLPNFRKQGFFSTIIDLTFKRSIELGASVYLGFAAAKNMSVNRLLEAGCEILPSHYFQFNTQSAKQTDFRIRVCNVDDFDAQKRAFNIRSKRMKGKSHFEYSLDEWKGQMINRPHPTFLCEVFDDRKNLGYFVTSDIEEKYRLIEFFAEDESFDEKIVLAAINYARQFTQVIDAYTIEANTHRIFQNCHGYEISGLLFLRACSQGADRSLTRAYLDQDPARTQSSLLPFAFTSGDRM